MKHRWLYVDGAAGGAFAGFCEAVTLSEDEPAVPAGGRDHGKAPSALAERPLQMLQMVADVPFGYLDDARQLLRCVCTFLEEGRDVVPDGLEAFGRFMGFSFSVDLLSSHLLLFVRTVSVSRWEV